MASQAIAISAWGENSRIGNAAIGIDNPSTQWSKTSCAFRHIDIFKAEACDILAECEGDCC